MKKEGKRMIIGITYWCFKTKSKRPHRAYRHSNVGAAIIWCPKHGVLTSQTMKRNSLGEKQMTRNQYKKFLTKRGF